MVKKNIDKNNSDTIHPHVHGYSLTWTFANVFKALSYIQGKKNQLHDRLTVVD